MSAGWQIGDIAVCVDARANKNWGLSKLKLNAFYTVTGLTQAPDPCSLNNDYAGLLLAECPCKSRYGFGQSRFRKIHPDTEPCEEEFTVLIKRGRKVSA